jgi:hypothetical protein
LTFQSNHHAKQAKAAFTAGGADKRTPEAVWEWLIICPRGKWLAIPKE